MSEMHLDLCIQSTNHLLETVATIKENIRILEVFLNSGLRTIDYKGFGIHGENYYSGEGRRSPFRERRLHQNLIGMDSSSSLPRKSHLNCCCMCHYRGATRENLKSSESKASVATLSISSNITHVNRKLNSGPRLIPRLNKTASLRREKVLQEADRKNSFY